MFPADSRFCLTSATVLSSHIFVGSESDQRVYTHAFCPLQPAIVLAPVNCTQTTAPQTEVPLTPKPEAQPAGIADPGAEKAQEPAQEQPATEKHEEENKSD